MSDGAKLFDLLLKKACFKIAKCFFIFAQIHDHEFRYFLIDMMRKS